MSDQPLTFPADCTLRFHFQPPQPFGTEAGGGRTAVLGAAAEGIFNANTGEHTIASTPPLSPLDVSIAWPKRIVKLEGKTFTILERFESLRVMGQVIESVFYIFPSLLNVLFGDPPIIERVDGKVGNDNFRWELAAWAGEFYVTTQQLQEEHFAKAWERMAIVADPKRRRLVAGLHYFHVACRLRCAASTAGEFVAEVVLNLAKALEGLFPPSRDAARAGLRSLGFSETQIECDFLPAMALRNEINVGHVELGLFKMDQLRAVHAFTERAERAFRDMFDRLLSKVESGEFEIAAYALGPPRKRAINLINRLKQGNEQATQSSTNPTPAA